MDERVGISESLKHLAEDQYVEVMFARTQEEAQRCRELLEGHAIPARVERPDPAAQVSGVSVLVPSDHLDDASEILALEAQEEDEEFDDGVFDDADDDEYEDDDDDDFDDDDDDDDDAEGVEEDE